MCDLKINRNILENICITFECCFSKGAHMNLNLTSQKDKLNKDQHHCTVSQLFAAQVLIQQTHGKFVLLVHEQG